MPALRTRLLLALVTLAAYAASFSGPFQFDDHGVIVNYEPVHSLSGFWSAFASGLRPLLKLTYALNWQIGAGSAAVFHVFNFLLHLCNVELVMRLYSAASERSRRFPFTELDRGAFAAGFLFALHPIQTEAVTYISGRSTSLATSFVLLVLLCYAEGVRSKKLGWWLGLSGASFFAALLTKETSGTVPLLLLAWELIIERAPKREIVKRQAAWWLAGLLLLTIAIMHERYFSLLYNALGQRPLLSALEYQLAGIGYLASRVLLLSPLSIDPGLGITEPARGVVIATGLMLCLAIGLAIVKRRSQPLFAFAVAWFVTQAFLPYLVFQRMDVLNERHFYLAGVGIFVWLGAVWARAVLRFEAHWVRYVVPLVVGGLLIWKTIARNLEYRSEIALWQSTTRASPNNYRAHNNLGIAYELSERLAEARLAYTRALLIEPKYNDALENLERVTRRIQDKARTQAR